MRVFDQEKSQELFYYDLEKGYLIEDRLLVKKHPEIPATEGVGHYKNTYFPNGGVEREWVWDIEPQNAVESWDEYEEVQVYVPYTAEQLKEKRIVAIKERLSQLSEDFVQSWAGAYIEDIEERKKEFAELHNQLRLLLGKTPRTYF